MTTDVFHAGRSELRAVREVSVPGVDSGGSGEAPGRKRPAAGGRGRLGRTRRGHHPGAGRQQDDNGTTLSYCGFLNEIKCSLIFTQTCAVSAIRITHS